MATTVVCDTCKEEATYIVRLRVKQDSTVTSIETEDTCNIHISNALDTMLMHLDCGRVPNGFTFQSIEVVKL